MHHSPIWGVLVSCGNYLYSPGPSDIVHFTDKVSISLGANSKPLYVLPQILVCHSGAGCGGRLEQQCNSGAGRAFQRSGLEFNHDFETEPGVVSTGSSCLVVISRQQILRSNPRLAHNELLESHVRQNLDGSGFEI